MRWRRACDERHAGSAERGSPARRRVAGRRAASALIQGLGYGRWGWEPVTGPLAIFRVLTFDNRGIDSDTPPGPYTVRDLADDAAAVLDAFDVERAHVVGTSLGGMVAQELALSRPERVERLVLACTTRAAPRRSRCPSRRSS